MAKSLSDFYNGIGQKYESKKFADMTNVDVHTEIGSVRPQLALAKESGSTITEACYRAVNTNGDVYFFSASSGKIWKRTQAGAYSLAHTNTNTAHNGAIFFGGYIYYSTATKLGRFDLSSTWTDSYQTLSSGEHGMAVFDLTLYICNVDNIASVDATGTFSASVLDLPPQYTAQALIGYGDDLLILGTSDYINDSIVYRWDTVSPSWTTSDLVKENNVFAFLDADNYIFVLAESGKIYLYDGKRLTPFKTMPAFSTWNQQLTTNFKGRPLIANGNNIYSLYRAEKDFPFALTCEYTATNTIKSICASGDDLLVATNDGVDNRSTNRATATIETPISVGKYKDVSVGIQSLPSGTSITMTKKQDAETSFTTKTTTTDLEDTRTESLTAELDIKRIIQNQIILTSSGANYPIIDSIILEEQ